MPDQPFDSQIKSALLNYEDTTSPALGWSRMTTGTQVSGFRKALWASLIVNAILLIVVPFFYFKIEKVNSRLVEMERYASEKKETSAAPLFSLEKEPAPAAIEEPVKPKRKEFVEATPSLALLPKEPKENEVESLLALSYYPAKPLDTEWNTSNRVLGKNLHSLKKGPIEPKSTKTNLHISHAALMDLEKSQFGRGVHYQYGLSVQSPLVRNPNYNGGFGAAAGVDAAIRFSPVWSIQSGIGLGSVWMNASDSAKVHDQYVTYTSGNGEGLESMQKRIVMLRVPVYLNYHYILNDRTTLMAGFGPTVAIKMGARCVFTQKIQENHSEPYENEYHTVNTEYEDRKWSIFSTSFHYELGIIRAMEHNANSWGLSTFYETPMVTSSTDANANQIGIRARLIFRTH